MLRGKKVVKEGGNKKTNIIPIYAFCLFPEHKCTEGYIKCADGIQCIRKHSMCNSDGDCNDGSDELEETCRGGILQQV